MPYAFEFIDKYVTGFKKAQLDSLMPIGAVRGRPKSGSKKLLLSVRYSVEVLEYFRATGEGWQGRMDSVLRQYVNKQAPPSNAP